MARKGPEMYNNYVQQWGGDSTKKTSRFKMFSTHKLDKSSSTPKLLDTSVIIDGRIKELCATGLSLIHILYNFLSLLLRDL